MNPVRRERPKAGQVKGCIVYLIVVPAITFLLWIVVAASSNWVLTRVLRTTQHIATWSSVTFLPVIFLAVLKATWRDFRGGKAAMIVPSDRIDGETARDRRSFPFSSLSSIHLKPHYDDLAVILCPVNGKPFKLPPDISSFSVIRRVFDDTVISPLAERPGGQVQAGETIHLDESRLLALLRISWGSPERSRGHPDRRDDYSRAPGSGPGESGSAVHPPGPGGPKRRHRTPLGRNRFLQRDRAASDLLGKPFHPQDRQRRSRSGLETGRDTLDFALRGELLGGLALDRDANLQAVALTSGSYRSTL